MQLIVGQEPSKATDRSQVNRWTDTSWFWWYSHIFSHFARAKNCMGGHLWQSHCYS